MTENNQTELKEGGIAILPKTETRPIAIVGMDGITEEVKTLSERLRQIGLTHVVMSVEEVEKEGITREDLLKAQLEQKLDSSMLNPPRYKGTNMQKKFVRKKKGKKTHRKKK
jgi:hypothetical protein